MSDYEIASLVIMILSLAIDAIQLVRDYKDKNKR